MHSRRSIVPTVLRLIVRTPGQECYFGRTIAKKFLWRRTAFNCHVCPDQTTPLPLSGPWHQFADACISTQCHASDDIAMGLVNLVKAVIFLMCRHHKQSTNIRRHMSHYRPIFFRRNKEMGLFEEGYTFFNFNVSPCIFQFNN